MLKYLLSCTAFCFLGLASQVAQAQAPFAFGDRMAQGYAMGRPWHGNYYYLPYGQPTALVVPPTATTQQTYSWGVSQNVIRPMYHQFGRSAPMSSPSGRFMGTPRWPSHTDQFGVYPVRGPW